MPIARTRSRTAPDRSRSPSPPKDDATTALSDAIGDLITAEWRLEETGHHAAQEQWRAAYFKAFRLMECGGYVRTAGVIVRRTEDRITIEPFRDIRRAM